MRQKIIADVSRQLADIINPNLNPKSWHVKAVINFCQGSNKTTQSHNGEVRWLSMMELVQNIPSWYRGYRHDFFYD